MATVERRALVWLIGWSKFPGGVYVSMDDSFYLVCVVLAFVCGSDAV